MKGRIQHTDNTLVIKGLPTVDSSSILVGIKYLLDDNGTNNRDTHEPSRIILYTRRRHIMQTAFCFVVIIRFHQPRIQSNDDSQPRILKTSKDSQSVG